MVARAFAVMMILLIAGLASANPLLGHWETEDEASSLRFTDDRVTLNVGGDKMTSWYRVDSIDGDRISVSILEPGSQTRSTKVLFRVSGSELRMTNPQSGRVETFDWVKAVPADQPN